MRNLDKIIIHMSETPAAMDIGIDTIRQWHVQERGFSDVGYHYVIKRDGTIEYGRPLDQAGAHCYGQNAHSIGICYVGGKGGDNRTDLQIEAMHRLVRSLIMVFGLMTVHGHDEFSDKACPNFNVKEEFDYV